MKYLLKSSRIQYLIQNRNGYLALSFLLLVLNILLVIYLFYARRDERIVVIPPNVEKTFWVSASQVSPEYLSEMALFVADLRLNVTPSNAETQRNVLLRYVAPSSYEALKMDLIAEAEHLKKEHITTAFYVVDLPKVDSNKLVAKIVGDLQSSVGDTQLSPQRVMYQIKFTYNAGRLLIKSFEETNDHD